MTARWVILILASGLLACEQSADVKGNQSHPDNLASQANEVGEEELGEQAFGEEAFGQQQPEIMKGIEPKLGQLLSNGYAESRRVPKLPAPSESFMGGTVATKAIIFGRRSMYTGLVSIDLYECAVPEDKQFESDWSESEMVDWDCEKIDE